MRVVDSQTGSVYYRKRRRRYDHVLCPHELTFSCYKGFQFFAKDRSRQWFVEALQDVRQNQPIELWAWVVMPEHVHLLVSPRKADLKIGLFAGRVKEIVARRAIAWLTEHAPQWLSKISVREGKTIRRRFWQPGGGYDRSIDNPHTLMSVIQYIHANPVRRGLVARAEEWHWSSARWYAGLPGAYLEMDRTLPVFEE